MFGKHFSAPMPTSRNRRVVVFSLAALLIGCEAPLDPVEPDLTNAPQLAAAADRHREDPVCARRVSVQRTARADAGVRTVTPDSIAEQTLSGSGAFQVSFGASAGSNGLGAQSWTKQSTNIECDSWSIGRQSFLLMNGSGWGDLRAETMAKPGSDGTSRAGARSETVVAFELERTADLKLEVHLNSDWAASDEPNASWIVCSGITATLARTTIGDSGTVLHHAVFSCDGTDPAQHDAFQWKGELKPGSYELSVGDEWAGGGIAALSTGGAAAAHTFATGDWKFQFVLKEL